ncbi:SMI1/KNR4 family protein [Streptomyces sp. NPDC004126]|uniref:SMI1/KNR4 family protein n=1 Tax=Streptomyces sp. NPDC004126 TaxID=3390695 RepID=UPI003D08E45F
MTAHVSESWTRIEDWLAEHAPASRAALAPPADPADIAAAERVIGSPLLKPLVTSLLRHDGSAGEGVTLLPGFYAPMSAREIADDWRLLTRYHDRTMPEEEEADADDHFLGNGAAFALYGHPDFIPVARDVTGRRLVLDQRTWSDRGRVHEAEPVTGLVRVAHQAWTSLPALLEGTADALETGRPLGGHTPAVDEQRRLRWEFG